MDEIPILEIVCDQIMSSDRSARCSASLVIPAENSNKLLHELNIKNEKSYQTGPPSTESIVKEANTIPFWTEELDPAISREVYERETELIDNEVLYSYVLDKEPGGGPIRSI